MFGGTLQNSENTGKRARFWKKTRRKMKVTIEFGKNSIK